MPHECTTCGRTFDDGSKQMLSGCPNCGGNKFQFQPPGRKSRTDEGAADHASSAPESTEPLSDSGTEGELDLPDDTAHAAEAASDDTGDAVDAEAENAAEPEIEAETTNVTDADAAATESAEEGFRDAEIDEFRDAEIDDGVAEENSAQSDARTSSVSMDEITEARREMAEAEEERGSEPEASARGTTQGPPRETPSGDETEAFDVSGAVGPEDGDPVEKQPVAGSAPESEEPVADDDADLKALRDELNDQFESIKITAPGQYELNLMELYDRKEYIISLQEDGRYVIEMADDYGIDDG